jgi:transposase
MEGGWPVVAFRAPVPGAPVLVPAGAGVVVSLRPVDLRKDLEGLAALVREGGLGHPYSGDVYVFRGRTRGDLVKLLWWDGSGLVSATKRLDAGRLRWPRIKGAALRLRRDQLAALLAGERLERPRQSDSGRRAAGTGAANR